MKPTAADTLNGIPVTISAKMPPTTANGTLSRMRTASLTDFEGVEEKQEYQEDAHRHDDLEARHGALLIFKLAAPGDVITFGQLDLLANRALRVGDHAAHIAPVQEDADGSEPIS